MSRWSPPRSFLNTAVTSSISWEGGEEEEGWFMVESGSILYTMMWGRIGSIGFVL